MREIPKAYQPQDVEDKVYQQWEESGYFNPDNLTNVNQDYFSISMPPPNRTGTLHTGHAIMLAYEDLMTRYNRLLGKKTLWLPGTDHAAIATQAKVEKILYEKEKKTRHDLGKEKFLKKVVDFAEESKKIINNQVRKMGSSCDWSRERYTLDQGLTRVVKYAFLKMHEAGVLYRGDRIVNWCPHCMSTLSDDEVEYKETKGKFYTFKYTKDFPLSISTTRPETKLGDTAVAVNPKDKRYKKYIGQIFTIDIGAGPQEIKIIADESVDPDFGTGALGVTPAHSMIDYDMAQKNKLPVVKVIGENGQMTIEAGKNYQGLHVLAAREKLINWLKGQGLLEKEEEVDMNLSVCYRCGETIEPLPSKQWWIDVNKKITLDDNKYFKNKSIKQVALQVVKAKEIKIIPQHFENEYYRWLDNLRDWCISRQIWFGHQVPVWYKNKGQDNEEVYVGIEAPKEKDWQADEDTLDTWFSSGLWTFSTLMDKDFAKYDSWEDWVKGSQDLEFHPTSVMETGYDILFFWVARMIIQTTFMLGEIPFKNVYLHGLVRDEKGRKMSKSLGNVVDPLDIIPKYGTDALRLAMISGTAAGADTRLYNEKVEGFRNFVNKLWNISRYILTSVNEVKRISERPQAKTLADEWILAKLDLLITRVSKDLDDFNFSPASEALREFAWDDLADWYLEITKNEKDKDEVLLYILEKLLILCHPFIPFVTEEIWSNFEGEDLIMIQRWPEVKEFDRAQKKEIENKVIYPFWKFEEIVMNIRNLRAEFKIDPGKKVEVTIVGKKLNKIRFEELQENIKYLAKVDKLNLADKKPSEGTVSHILEGVGEICLHLEGLVDLDKEKKRLENEIASVQKFINTVEGKLKNKSFVDNAPEAIVAKEKIKLADQKDKLNKLEEQLNSLK